MACCYYCCWHVCCGRYVKKMRSNEVSGYLTTYPSLKSSWTNSSHLGRNCDLGERWVVSQKPQLIQKMYHGWGKEGENFFAQTLSEQVPIKNFPQFPLPVTPSNTKIKSKFSQVFSTPPPPPGGVLRSLTSGRSSLYKTLLSIPPPPPPDIFPTQINKKGFTRSGLGQTSNFPWDETLIWVDLN